MTTPIVEDGIDFDIVTKRDHVLRVIDEGRNVFMPMVVDVMTGFASGAMPTTSYPMRRK